MRQSRQMGEMLTEGPLGWLARDRLATDVDRRLTGTVEDAHLQNVRRDGGRRQRPRTRASRGLRPFRLRS